MDPFQPPDTTSASPLVALPYIAAASAAFGMGLTCCCGFVGAFFAWLLPTVFLVWGVVLFASASSTDELRQIGKHTAVISFVGLVAIPVCFVFSLCLTGLFLIPADIDQFVLDTIMSA